MAYAGRGLLLSSLTYHPRQYLLSWSHDTVTVHVWQRKKSDTAIASHLRNFSAWRDAGFHDGVPSNDSTAVSSPQPRCRSLPGDSDPGRCFHPHNSCSIRRSRPSSCRSILFYSSQLPRRKLRDALTLEFNVVLTDPARLPARQAPPPLSTRTLGDAGASPASTRAA